MAMEELYSHYQRPRTAILMGHARGVICLAAAQAGIPVVHYASTQVKRILTGTGRAQGANPAGHPRELGLAQSPTRPTWPTPWPWPCATTTSRINRADNGYGERCGDANLSTIIANLELKLGHTAIGQDKLISLSTVARFVAELANLPLPNNQPFVGHSAFAHKGGVHVSAVLKESATYEHVTPEAVGNRQRVLISDLSGRGNILYKLKQHGLAEPIVASSTHSSCCISRNLSGYFVAKSSF